MFASYHCFHHKSQYVLILLLFLSLLYSCEKDSFTGEGTNHESLEEGTFQSAVFLTGSTYEIHGDVFFTDTLIIQPGAVIKLNGSLHAQYFSAAGNPDQPIIFTSVHDNSAGAVADGSTGNPQMGDWIALGPKEGEFRHCEIKYSVTGINLANKVKSISISDCFFFRNGKENTGAAIYSLWLNQADEIIVDRCIFEENFLPMQITHHVIPDTSNQFFGNVLNMIYFSNPGHAAGIVQLTATGVPWLIGDLNARQLYIDKGQTLYMLGGISVKALYAEGTEEQPIHFKAARNSEVPATGFPPDEQVSMDSWKGISISEEDGMPRSLSRLKYCNLENMSNSPNEEYSGIRVQNENIEISNCSFSNCYTSLRTFPSGTVHLENVENDQVLSENVFTDCNIPVTVSGNLHFDLGPSNIFQSYLHIGKPRFAIYFNQSTEVIGERLINVREIPIVFYNDLTVNPENYLALRNCILKFSDKGQINFSGSNLSRNEDVVFTSFLDDEHGGDSNCDMDLSSPGSCAWKGIYNTQTESYADWPDIYYADCN